jgi:hypothetical protein
VILTTKTNISFYFILFYFYQNCSLLLTSSEIPFCIIHQSLVRELQNGRGTKMQQKEAIFKIYIARGTAAAAGEITELLMRITDQQQMPLLGMFW